MNTFLLTWNPKYWVWSDLSLWINRIATDGFEISKWSCGNTLRIMAGDRIFLLRQGVEPRGICGVGTAVSGVFVEPHWNFDKVGKMARYVLVKWEVLLDSESESIFPREWLNTPPLSGVNWNTQISGIRIDENIALELSRRWTEFLSHRKAPFSLFLRGNKGETRLDDLSPETV